MSYPDDKILGWTDRRDPTPRPAFAFGDAGKNSVISCLGYPLSIYSAN